MNHDKDDRLAAKKDSPYAPPQSESRSPDRISDDPSVFDEPWMLADGSRWLVATMILHGTYNFSVTMLDVAGVEF